MAIDSVFAAGGYDGLDLHVGRNILNWIGSVSLWIGRVGLDVHVAKWTHTIRYDRRVTWTQKLSMISLI